MKTMPTLPVRACQCFLAVIVAMALASPQFAFAAVVSPITWEAAHNISGDSDVRTTGSLVVAFNVGATGVSGTTVNTVPFAAFAFPAPLSQTSGTISNVSFHETATNFYLFGNNSAGSGLAPFSGLPSAYKTLLSSYGYSDSPATLQITVGGLTTNQQYLIQAWSSVSSTGLSGTTRFSGLNNSGSYVDLISNTTSTTGGFGQYAVGTFTATGSTLVLELNGQSNALPVINALQIRAVPEPSTYVLAAIGACIAGLMRRGKQPRRTR